LIQKKKYFSDLYLKQKAGKTGFLL